MTRPLRFIGKISFSIFLLHFAVLFALMRNMPATWLRWTDGDPTAESVAVFVITMVITVPLSAFTYAVIEARGIAAGRALRHRLQYRPARTNLASSVIAVFSSFASAMPSVRSTLPR